MFNTRIARFPASAAFLATAMMTALPETAAAAGLPDMLVPMRSGLPSAWPVLKLLLLLTFFIHLVLVNILIGSTVLALVHCWRTPLSGFLVERETAFIPKVLALAVNFGVAPYLFLQVLYGNFLYPSIILMAIWWMSIAAFAMMAYYGLYVLSGGGAGGLSGRRLLLVLILGLLLLVAFLLSTANTLMLRPEAWAAWFARPDGTLLNLSDPTFAPRYLHILFGSLAVGGLVFAWRAHWNKPSSDPADADRRIREGLAWFYHATLLQLPVGVWFLFRLPPESQNIFLGGHPQAVAALVVGLSGMAVALVLARQGHVRATFGAALGVILVMVCMRDMARDAALRPFTDSAPHTLPLAQGQYGSFAVFLGCLCIAVFALAWLGRTAMKAFAGARASAPLEE